LPDGGIDADLPEQSLHAEGARLIGYDRHDIAPDVLVLEQHGESAHERHGRRDLAVGGSLEERPEGLERRNDERRGGAAAGRQEASERSEERRVGKEGRSGEWE